MVFTKMTDDAPQFGPDETQVLLNSLNRVIMTGVPGDIVELGCYKGETSVRIARFLAESAPTRLLYVYDSFAGLPPKASEDTSPLGEQFKAGELPVTKREVVERLRSAGFTSVRVKKGWFHELRAEDLPDTIALAFLDGDFYQSIRDSLRLVWPRLAPRAVVVVDDYTNPALPGAARAVDEWLRNHRYKSLRVEKSLAVIETV